MKITSYYPVIMTGDVTATAAFYQRYLGFQVVFDSDWYVHLRSAHDDSVNLAVLDGTHQTIPDAHHGTASGMILNFEVEDVDALYEEALRAGLPVLLPLRDEPFGQRHFLTRDPGGVLIDLITPIAPSAEFAAHYLQAGGASTS